MRFSGLRRVRYGRVTSFSIAVGFTERHHAGGMPGQGSPGEGETAETANGASLRPARRFALRFGLLAPALYLVLYFPYDSSSLPGRALEAYVKLVTALAGGVVRLFDSGVSVAGNLIAGVMSLEIILDCAAIDAQALFAATVISFSAPLGKKLLGLAVGIFVITTVNLGRIVALYLVGANWPRHFKFLHEEVFQFGIIAAACASFAVWALWVSGRLKRVHVAA